MRLSKEEIKVLKTTLYELDADASIYLFGSRTDDSKRGGDIDLLIVSNALTRIDKRTIRGAFFERFGEQKIDILLDDGSFDEPFHKLAFQRGMKL